MYEPTTPVHTFVLPIQTSTCNVILLTYKQDGVIKVEKRYENGTLPPGMVLNGNRVYQTLTQEETKLFDDEFVEAQIRVLTNEGKSHSSQEFEIYVNESLNTEVLS